MSNHSRYRRSKIVQNLEKLFSDNEEYSVVQLLHTIMRNKNNNSEDIYEMTDENFSSALQDTIIELEETYFDEEGRY